MSTGALLTSRTKEHPQDSSVDRAAAQLELFARRCLELADRVAENKIGFLDAVDMAYSAAQWSGLTDNVGDDIVQACMAAAFANARGPT
jgi:hypothetical protein